MIAGSMQSAASVWAPKDLGSTLVQWLDAAYGVTSSSGLISSVLDKSANGLTETASGGLRPTLISSANAGRPSISFNGSNRLDNATVRTVRSAFFVLSSIGANASTAALLSAGKLYLTLSGADNLAVFGGGSSAQSGQTLSGPIIAGFVARAMNDVDFYAAGVKVTVTSGSGVFWPDQQISIGQDPSGVQGSTFDFQESILCDSAISNADAVKLRAYLAAKYKLAG